MSVVVQASLDTQVAGWATFEEGAGPWHVLHTKVNQEKILAADLEAMEIACFLPLVPRVRYIGRQKLTVDSPLFPGYLFLRGPLDDVYRADRTKRVARVIRVSDQTRIEWELKNIAMALCNQAPLDPYPYLKKGIRVEVSAGPLRGLQGIIEDRTKNDRLILQVEMLGQASSLEIDGSLLDPIE